MTARSTQDAYTPRPEHHFTFGLWTVGNPGRDPFGDPVRAPIPPTRIVEKLAELGAYGVNLHDNDLVPRDASAAERDRIVREFKKALADAGMRVPMATTNLFGDPAFRDGAFTSNDARVRDYAIQKTMAAIDLGVELGAETYVFWGGREGVDTNAAKDPRLALERYRDAMNFLCEYVRSQGYSLRFALEAKPNEPRGDIFLATTGHMLAFIYTLDHPEMVGLNPEVAHEHMAGLDFTHGVAQALDAGKLFHIDLNAQKPGRFDQDLRFGSETPSGPVCGTSTATLIAPKTRTAYGISRREACGPISSSRRRSRSSTPTRRSSRCWRSWRVMVGRVPNDSHSAPSA